MSLSYASDSGAIALAGPWHASLDWENSREHGISICTADGPRDWRYPIAKVRYADDEDRTTEEIAEAEPGDPDMTDWYDDEAETVANALLIASAPEMHRALRFAQAVIKSGEPWTPECEAIIGGALRKARGEAV